jgi:hypothetical protein
MGQLAYFGPTQHLSRCRGLAAKFEELAALLPTGAPPPPVFEKRIPIKQVIIMLLHISDPRQQAECRAGLLAQGGQGGGGGGARPPGPAEFIGFPPGSGWICPPWGGR